MKKLTKSTKTTKKSSKKSPKRRKPRKNPLTKVELINKYVERKINFEYQILDEHGLKGYRKTGTLKYMPDKAIGWMVYFGKDKPIFYIYDTPVILNSLDIKEQTPFPLFIYIGHLNPDLSQSLSVNKFSLLDILALYKDKVLELWYTKNGKNIKEYGRIFKNTLGTKTLWELHVPKVLGNGYNIFYLDSSSVKVNYDPYLHLEWQKKVI
jgi:hypothetical protein